MKACTPTYIEKVLDCWILIQRRLALLPSKFHDPFRPHARLPLYTRHIPVCAVSAMGARSFWIPGVEGTPLNQFRYVVITHNDVRDVKSSKTPGGKVDAFPDILLTRHKATAGQQKIVKRMGERDLEPP